MGKSRKTKGNRHSVNPIGLPSVQDTDNALDDEAPHGGNHATSMELIIDQLKGATVDEQLEGLQMLSTLAEHNNNVIEHVDSELIRIAAPFLMDHKSVTLRHATSGAFRNLSGCGPEICEALIEHDLMTPLLGLFNEFRGDWTPTPATLDILGETFLNAVHLLSNLCESSSEALDQFNASHLLESFMRCLDHTVFGLDTSIAVGQLLLIVSEDNAGAWKVFTSTEAESSLTGLLQLTGGHPEHLLRTLAAAIMCNVPALASQFMPQITACLGKSFIDDHRLLLNRLSSDIPVTRQIRQFEVDIQDERADGDDEEEPMDDGQAPMVAQRKREAEKIKAIEDQVKQIGYLLEAQRVTAEILTNITSCDDDVDPMTDQDDNDQDSDAESVHDYDREAANGSVTNEAAADKLPVELLEVIKSMNLVEHLWHCAQPLAENVHDLLVRYERTLAKKLKGLRISCLLCLHNLCNVMSIEELGGPTSLYQVWRDLGQQVFQGSNSSDVHLLEATTALMRATLTHLTHSPELFATMSEADLQLILTGVQNCNEAEIRANWLRMLGTLACHLPVPLVHNIVAFLLDTSATDNDAWTISEGMDALVDMFADNDWPEIVSSVNLVQRTKQLERKLKQLVRQQKKELADRYGAVVTVRANLVRFIKYVEQELMAKM